MAFYKRCHEKGCEKSGPRCKHPWYLELMIDGVRERGPVTKYAHLLPPRADGQPRKVTNADELRELESYVVIWVKQGRPGKPPTPGGGNGGGKPEAESGTAGELRTVAAACDAYTKGHVDAMADKGAPSIMKRIKRELGTEPVARLFDRRLLREFLAEVEEDTSVVNSNRHLSRWSHMLTWVCAEYKLAGDSPFHHKTLNPTGIRKQREGTGRKRALTAAEERALRKALAAFDDGGMMLARFDCALDCALRRGEMLELRREDVIRDGPRVSFRIRWGTAKSRRERIVPVTSPRLLAFLKTRRFAAFVFGQRDGSRLASFRADWEQILIDAGIDEGKWEQRETAKGQRYGHWIRTVDGDLHWHDLRHEGATRLAKTTPPHELQALLGHADLGTTQVYLNADVSSLAANMARAQSALK